MRVTTDQIVAIAADWCGVDREEILDTANVKRKPVYNAREMIAYACRKFYCWGARDIGNRLYDTHHNAVWHQLRRADAHVANETPEGRRIVEFCKYLERVTHDVQL